MQRIIICVVGIMTLFSLVGCGQSQTVSANHRGKKDMARQEGMIANKEDPGTAIPARQPAGPGESVPIVKIARVNYVDESNMNAACLNSRLCSQTANLGSARHLPIYKFESRSELETFMNEYADCLNFNDCYDKMRSFHDAVSNYEEDFFAEHGLLCVYMAASSGSLRYRVKDILKKGSSLRVLVEQTNHPEVYTADMAGWLILAEQSKSDLLNIKEYDAQFVGAQEDINTPAPISAPQENTTDSIQLSTAISSVLREKYRSEWPDGLIHIQSYDILADQTVCGMPMTEETVYLIVYHSTYKVNEKPAELEGGCIPAVLTFSINEDGKYSLKEYWSPRVATGTEYENDIRAKFPEAVIDDALHIEKYAKSLKNNNWNQLTEYLDSAVNKSVI